MRLSSCSFFVDEWFHYSILGNHWTYNYTMSVMERRGEGCLYLCLFNAMERTTPQNSRHNSLENHMGYEWRLDEAKSSQARLGEPMCIWVRSSTVRWCWCSVKRWSQCIVRWGQCPIKQGKMRPMSGQVRSWQSTREFLWEIYHFGLINWVSLKQRSGEAMWIWVRSSRVRWWQCSVKRWSQGVVKQGKMKSMCGQAS